MDCLVAPPDGGILKDRSTGREVSTCRDSIGSGRKELPVWRAHGTRVLHRTWEMLSGRLMVNVCSIPLRSTCRPRGLISWPPCH